LFLVIIVLVEVAVVVVVVFFPEKVGELSACLFVSAPLN